MENNGDRSPQENVYICSESHHFKVKMSDYAYLSFDTISKNVYNFMCYAVVLSKYLRFNDELYELRVSSDPHSSEVSDGVYIDHIDQQLEQSEMSYLLYLMSILGISRRDTWASRSFPTHNNMQFNKMSVVWDKLMLCEYVTYLSVKLMGEKCESRLKMLGDETAVRGPIGTRRRC